MRPADWTHGLELGVYHDPYTPRWALDTAITGPIDGTALLKAATGRTGPRHGKRWRPRLSLSTITN